MTQSKKLKKKNNLYQLTVKSHLLPCDWLKPQFSVARQPTDLKRMQVSCVSIRTL